MDELTCPKCGANNSQPVDVIADDGYVAVWMIKCLTCGGLFEYLDVSEPPLDLEDTATYSAWNKEHGSDDGDAGYGHTHW